MPISTGIEVLKKAHEGIYAVGAFNFNNLETLQAILEAAEELEAPVIVETSEGAIKYAGAPMLFQMVEVLAKKISIPVVIHLDHGKDFDIIMTALRSGYTSVMIDASSHPFEENVRQTKKIAEIAHAMGVSVEAELGTLKGIEDNVSVDERDATLINPQQAITFVRETGIDYLAPAIGTSHGAFKYKGESKIDFERLKEVKRLTGIPLVLHGASGVPQYLVEKAEKFGAKLTGAKGVSDDVLKEAVACGINKVNTDTDLRIATVGAIREVLSGHPEEIDPRKILGPAREAMKEVVKHRIRLLGSAGKANA
jgi:fructose-bisphosphate aldolase class II